jgi:hypothetical protein
MARRLVLLYLTFVATSGCHSAGPAPISEPFGHFEGVVVASFNEDSTTMTLTQDFAYVDPRLKRWVASKGLVTDGASIPRAFWTIIGNPFQGPYRNGAVIHDAACEEMKEDWQDVHLMFYEACRCGGVGESKAKLMYWAVYQFGPRWKTVSEVRKTKDGKVETITRTIKVAPPGMPPDEGVARKADEYFSSNNPSLEEIKELKLDGK